MDKKDRSGVKKVQKNYKSTIFVSQHDSHDACGHLWIGWVFATEIQVLVKVFDLEKHLVTRCIQRTKVVFPIGITWLVEVIEGVTSPLVKYCTLSALDPAF